MAFQGFGKQSGPSGGASLRPETSFGNFPPNPPPPLHSYSREPETQVRSPAFPIEGFRPALVPSNTFSVVQRPSGTTPNWGSGKNSTASPPFPAFNNPRPSYPVRNVQVQDMKRIRPPPFLSRDEDHGRNSRTITVRHSVNQRAPSPPPGFQNSPHLDDHGSFTDAQRHSVSQRAPSPPFGFQNARHLDDLDSFSDAQRHSVNQRAPSPPSGFQNGRHLDDIGSFSDAQRHSISQRAQSPPPGFQNGGHLDNLGSFSSVQRHSVSQRAKSPPSNFQIRSFGNVQRNSSPTNIRPTHKPSTNFTNSLIQQGLSSVSTNIGTFNSSRNFPSNQEETFMPNRTRSPPLSYADIASPEDSTFAGENSKRPSLSPPRTSIRPNARFDIPDNQNHRGSPPTKTPNRAVQKRSRSPSFISSDQGFEGDSSAQDDTERELQAKAKRLARFKEELSQPEPSNIVNQKHPLNKQDRPAVDMQTERSEMMIVDFHASADFEAQESSTIIIGLCPDMCPETERGERERKGDLDQYERMGGDRNLTDKSLAVKKYTRTAEREAGLIRPMHILQMTLDYLLNLLDHPYDEKFLGLYNFLWDRMRAIRMDLRMQHIFNQGAITMLEQMIRLHIIAMHELCEYTKGEGFSEGFDAHLNIEQMNKASVELFQLYDDHRKKGMDVPTEKEFRGYYALLKLDKHPGYKVEPAELSLDLAKMTPEIRQTSEIVFARDVARACRAGNYIAFFRLARKASYLQACLMHAHFAKLRSQALAALHSGLQNSQGIPISQISKWLAMEDEDIENLLDHHGFVIKEFEEPFMVKEGNFLGGENDYPLQCSKLVHNKKSTRIFKDVSSPSLMENFSSRIVKELKPKVISPKEPKRVHFSEIIRSPILIDKKMPDFQAVPSPKKFMQVTPLNKSPVPTVIPVEVAVEAKKNSAEKPRIDIFTQNPFKRNLSFDVKAMPSQVSPKRVQLQQQILLPLQVDHQVEIPVDQSLLTEDFQNDESFDFPEEVEPETEMEEISTNSYDKEVAEAKLRLILRIWKRRCSRRREIRERKQLEAHAALSKLSLGPPIWNDKHIEITSRKFNINQVMRERYDEHGKSWSKVNVSEVVATKLSERNPNSRCLCWKILLISQLEGNEQEQISHLAAGSWLCSKIIPTEDSNEDGFVISKPDLFVWKKWVPNQSNDDTCCLSVIKDTNPSSMNDESVLGASAVIFVVYNAIPWKLQKTLLNCVLDSIPSGSRLPLLILIGSEMDGPDSSPIPKELGLQEVDKSRISEYSIISLIEDHSFFSDNQLREGLEWLASESPLQPNLHRLKTCDLVRSHLNPKLEALDRYNGYEVSPNHCISALNEALDSSLEDIMTTANSNPIYWPCPEMKLLNEYSYEQNAVDMYLPSAGWNLPKRLDSLTHTISQCKLPTFSEDISWLFRGSELGMDTETQGSRLEDCLIRYLSETSHLMGISLAKKEANVMLQKCARLELQGSTYYIVPKWAMIFRRIFNWRLTSLNYTALSDVYILEECRQSISNSSIVVFESTESYLIPPSLDEMVEVRRIPLKPDTYFEARKRPTEPKNDVINFVKDDMPSDDRNTEIVSNKKLELGFVGTDRKETDKLTKLLEQCNIVQNLNAEKLSIYF